jgi:aminomethyltransferase
MTTLLVEGDAAPVHGAAVTRGGRAVGEVRSACLSPTLGRVIALAVLDTAEIVIGAAVRVELDGGVAAGEVGGYPVYDPEKLRTRS